jgi:hypothetical protein
MLAGKYDWQPVGDSENPVMQQLVQPLTTVND